MPVDSLSYLIIGIIAVYLTGALVSLFLRSHIKLSNLITFTIASIASLTGIVFSLCKIIFYPLSPVTYKLESNINLISINFFIDNLSAIFILIISVLAFLVSIYSIGYMKHYFFIRNIGYFGFLYNIFIASMILVVSSGQLFYFLIAWELMSLVSYFLVVYENEKSDVQRAGKLYIIMTHIGTAFIIAAFSLLYTYTGSAELASINASLMPAAVKNLVFIFLLIGFGTKAGIIPFHIWLPYAHPAAPSNVSALMSGVMIKTAIYGILRFVMFSGNTPEKWWGITVLAVGIVSCVLGIAYALMENEIKKVMAYCSIENIGIILIGVGVSIIGASRESYFLSAAALSAALLHLFNHSIFKGLLFLCAGSIHYSTKTKNIEKLGGLIRKMPITALVFLAGILAVSAIPPFNGFVGEWMTYQSLLSAIGQSGSHTRAVLILAVAALALAGVLAAYTFIKVYGISILAMPRTGSAEKAAEVPKTMLLAKALLALICLVAGIFPMFILRLIDTVNKEFFNVVISGNLNGFAGFISFPVKLNGSGLSILTVVLLAMIIIPLLFYTAYITGRKTKIRKYGTWDCGYTGLNSRMQYTATGFSKPWRIVFRGIYRPQRELQLDKDASKYSFKTAKYIVSTQSVIEKYMYEPIIKHLIRFARKARLLIQTGSVHTYLIYIFIAIIAMFIYYIKA